MREVARQDAVMEALAERGLGALIVTDLANVRYLTGYVGSNGIALVGPRGRKLVTDSRYAVAAREQARGVEVVIGRRDLLGPDEREDAAAVQAALRRWHTRALVRPQDPMASFGGTTSAPSSH